MLIMPVSLYLDIILLILLRIYFKDIKFDSIEQISKYTYTDHCAQQKAQQNAPGAEAHPLPEI